MPNICELSGAHGQACLRTKRFLVTPYRHTTCAVKTIARFYMQFVVCLNYKYGEAKSKICLFASATVVAVDGSL